MNTTRRSVDARDPFVVGIDARIAALERLRASYLEAKAAGAIGPTGDLLEAAVSPPLEAPVAAAPEPGRRRGRIAAEIEGILLAASGPLKTRQIADVLRDRRVVPAAAKVEPTINSTLSRLKHHGRAVRTPDGWVVPNGAHAPIVTRVPPRRTRQARRPRVSGEPTPDRRPDGLAWRIESLLRSHGRPVAARYVADATGEPLNVVGLTLGRMVRQQRVERQADGHFSVLVPLDDAGADSRPEGT
jgi:hypothetical protein